MATNTNNVTNNVTETINNLTKLVKTDAGKAALREIEFAVEHTDMDAFRADDNQAWIDAWVKNNIPGFHPDVLEAQEPSLDVFVAAMNTFAHANDDYKEAVERFAKYAAMFRVETELDRDYAYQEVEDAMMELLLVVSAHIMAVMFSDYKTMVTVQEMGLEQDEVEFLKSLWKEDGNNRVILNAVYTEPAQPVGEDGFLIIPDGIDEEYPFN